MKYMNHSYFQPYYEYILSNTNDSLHQHEQIEISYVISGNLTYTTNQPYNLHTGDLILLFPYEPHSFSCASTDTIFSMLLDIDFIPDFKRRFLEYQMPEYTLSSKNLNISSRHALEWLIRYAHSNHELGSETALLKKKGWLTVLLGDIFDKKELKKRKEALKPDLIRQLLQYMDQNLQQELTAESLSRELGVSQHYLSRSIKQQLQVSLNTLLISVRLSHAEHLLKTTDASLLEIALYTGFQNVQTFSRNFKKETGISPLEFRRQLLDIE